MGKKVWQQGASGFAGSWAGDVPLTCVPEGDYNMAERQEDERLVGDCSGKLERRTVPMAVKQKGTMFRTTTARETSERKVLSWWRMRVKMSTLNEFGFDFSKKATPWPIKMGQDLGRRKVITLQTGPLLPAAALFNGRPLDWVGARG